MDLTLIRTQRPDAVPATRQRRWAALGGPLGVLLASSALAGVFLYLVADLVARLG
jgi:hypothetical protein